jgi:hypothetical protein
MGPMALGALLGAGVGYAKNEFIDGPRNDQWNKGQAEVTRWSPWTGITGQIHQGQSSADAALQGGMSGAMMGQNMDQQDQNQQMFDMQKQYLGNEIKGQGSGLGSSPTAAPAPMQTASMMAPQAVQPPTPLFTQPATAPANMFGGSPYAALLQGMQSRPNYVQR